MKLTYRTGCICNDLTIDGENFNSKCRIEREQIIKDVIAHASDQTLQYFLISFLEDECDFNIIGTCEQCGDSILEYNFEI